MIKVECDRCLGKGRINAYAGIQNGICFKCNDKGFVLQKNPPRIQKTFKVSFLWLDKDDCNYNNGDFCHCWSKKYPSMNKARLDAETKMKKNGSSDFKVEIAL
jgi:hypothetical protein